MYSLDKDKQKQLKDFFKIVQKNNKKLDYSSSYRNVLVELEGQTIIFNYTNGHFLVTHPLKTELTFEKKQLFIPESLIEFFCKNSITSIELEDEKLILKMNYFDKITIEKEKIVIETDNSQTIMEVKIENYPDINIVKNYFDITENHFTIQLNSEYLSDLITGKYVKLQINLSREYSAVIVTADNGMNSIIMPMTLSKDDKARNQEIQRKLNNN
jgi:hypothetical protein